MNNKKLLYPDLSYSIIGSAMDVHNELGPGWTEWDYHRAMIESLSSNDHVVVSHDRRGLIHRGNAVDHFELDLLVDDLVILELKHIKNNFHPIHYTQIINYLKLWRKNLGILINYGLETLRYDRIPYTPVQSNVRLEGAWSEVAGQVSVCGSVRKSVECLLRTHGAGFGANIFKKLLFSELKYMGLQPTIPWLAPNYGALCFEKREIGAVQIGSELLLLTSASNNDTSAADLVVLKSYMRQAGIPCGVLVNSDKSGVQLRGVL